MIDDIEYMQKHLKPWGNIHNVYEKFYIIFYPLDMQPELKRKHTVTLILYLTGRKWEVWFEMKSTDAFPKTQI